MQMVVPSLKSIADAFKGSPVLKQYGINTNNAILGTYNLADIFQTSLMYEK
jgi:hypothetical protein